MYKLQNFDVKELFCMLLLSHKMTILKLSSELISGCLLLFQVHLGGVIIKRNQGHMNMN